MYAPNDHKKIQKAKLTKPKREIHSFTIIAGDFNIPFSIMNRIIRQNISNEIEDLNNTVSQLNLIDVDRTLYSKQYYTRFSQVQHGTFTRIDHILGKKLSTNRFLKTSTKQSIFFDHNRMKLEINNRSKTRKPINLWKLNSTLLNNQLIKEKTTKNLENLSDE